MTLIFEHTTILLFIFVAIILLISYSIFSFKKLEVAEVNRLNNVFSEIEVEKQQQISLKNTSLQIDELEIRTQQTFKKINVELFTIDFSYKEVLKKL